MAETRKCPDCGGAMEMGFIPDATNHSVMQPQWPQWHRSNWHRGPAAKAKVLGLDNGVKVTSYGLFPIEAYRCTKCFLVRSYAPPRPPRKG